MLKVDASDAPEGFFATAMVDACLGCSFDPFDGECQTDHPCMREEREDGCEVIFKRKEDVNAKD